jgi:Putative Actinobacterial Holin-X, holin superfamily III
MSTPLGTQPPDDGRDLRQRPLGELFSTLGREAKTLVQQQIALARAELARRGTRLATGIGMLVAGAGVAVFTAAAFTAFAIAGLATLMATWLAALIVTAVYGLIMLVLVLRGLSLVRSEAPNLLHDTTESIKEDVEWIKGQRISGPTSG